MSSPSVAMIGSFHKNLPEMQKAIEIFTSSGIDVVNPLSTEPIRAGVDFVRFPTDQPELSDAVVQCKALERILGATAVYVICPEGYIGRTTSYEWGWVEANGCPAYFSEIPNERFMRRYAQDRVVTAPKLAELINRGNMSPLNLSLNL
jgi:hypothetical protein